MILQRILILLGVALSCNGLRWDENYDLGENMTLIDVFMKSMELSDYRVPNIGKMEKDYIKIIAPKLLALQPPFDMSRNFNVSLQCRKDSRNFVKSLQSFELWALKMHDATAKLSSGLLNGNVNNYGDFDQCLDTIANSDRFQGQYCLAHIEPKITDINYHYLNYLRTLTLSFEAYKSKFEDPSHVVPKTSEVHWGLCVPSTCTHEEVQLVLSELLNDFTNHTGIKFDVEVLENMCQVKNENWMSQLSIGTKIAIGFFITIFILSILSAIYEAQPCPEKKNEWLTAFSITKSWNDLINLKQPNGDIPSPHGIRFATMAMLIISHKCMEVDFNPIVNRNEMILTSRNPVTVIVRASYLYTDTFIMLSGMLVTYSFIGRLQRGQTINILKEIAGRYFRVMPPIAALIIFGTFILPILSNGPQWNLLITYQSELCKQTWWRNFLMIHNWFGFQNICMTHTHHVGTDFELFLVAPILIILLHRYPKKTSIVVIIISIVATFGKFYVNYSRNLTVYVLFGLDISKLYEIADHMYILPPYRFPVYSIGIFLGYLLRKHKDVKLSPAQVNLGWFLATGGFLATLFFTATMSVYNYDYDAMDAALYSSLASIPWCLFFAWIIYVAQLGYKNGFVNVLEWRGFMISTKLSYGIYLVQFAVFHYNIGKTRSSSHFGIVKSVLNTNEILWIVLVATILTLFIEYPFGNLKKLIFDQKQASKESPKLDKNANELPIKKID